jgi:hypothetical protein
VRRAVAVRAAARRLVVVSSSPRRSWLRAQRPATASREPRTLVGPAPEHRDHRRSRVTRPPVNGSSRPALTAAAQQAVRAARRDLAALADGHVHAGGHRASGPRARGHLEPGGGRLASPSSGPPRKRPSRARHDGEGGRRPATCCPPAAPGVGVHWVNWQLIAQPFDPPARRCCCSHTSGSVTRWSASPTGCRALPPAGFAGTNDRWHTHAGLCVVNGWVEREEVPPRPTAWQLARRLATCGCSTLGRRPLLEPLGPLRPEPTQAVPNRTGAGHRLLHA